MKKLIFVSLLTLFLQILSDEECGDSNFGINKQTVAGQYNPAYAIACKGKYSPYQSSHWP